MALLSFKQAKGPIKLSLMSGAVPVVVGERGIGKTSIAKSIAKDLGMRFAHIDGNLLKEGEIGGLPTVVGSNKSSEEFDTYCQKLIAKAKTVDEDQYSKLFKLFSKKYSDSKNVTASDRLVTAYATFHVLDKIVRWYEEDKETEILLFIDELNRCEHSVQQELMNLILNREINGLELPPTVRIMAAINPSNKFTEFKHTNYQTVDMDDAQEDRMRWFFIGSDEKVWIDWASTIINEDTGDTIIHSDVIEFIASNPDALNQPQSSDDVKPSPRSWERLSDSYKSYLSNRKHFTENDLYHVARGDMGPTVAVQFTQFLKDNSNPLVKPEEIFETKHEKLTSDIRNKIKNESLPRMLMTIKNCLRYLVRNKKTAKVLNLYTEVVTLLPKDLMVMVMMNTLNENKPVHDKLVQLDDYLDAFHDIDVLVD